MEKSEIKELLNTLKSIDSTLKRIEQNTKPKKQQDATYNAVSKAFLGNKAEPIPLDDTAEYIASAVQSAVKETIQKCQ